MDLALLLLGKGRGSLAGPGAQAGRRWLISCQEQTLRRPLPANLAWSALCHSVSPQDKRKCVQRGTTNKSRALGAQGAEGCCAPRRGINCSPWKADLPQPPEGLLRGLRLGLRLGRGHSLGEASKSVQIPPCVTGQVTLVTRPPWVPL